MASIEEVKDAITNTIMCSSDFKIQVLEGGCQFCIKLQVVVSPFFFIQNMFPEIHIETIKPIQVRVCC